jgi:hypothetical protein
VVTGRHRRPRPGRYLPGAAGAAAYRAAAARNTTARGDPQRTRLVIGPSPDPRRYRDDMMVVCCCHDTKGEHRLDDDTGQRGACTVATADGPCGCRRFTPRTVTEGEGTPDVHQRP